MIPLSDVDRRPVRFPVLTAAIVGMNCTVFLLELLLGDQFVLQWSYIPQEIVRGENLVTLVTAMFIHGGWLHIIGNMVYLWAFGPEIEDAMGRTRFLLFYFSGGIAASLAQVMMNAGSESPNLGASGAIAAVMGAFLVSFPSDRIKTILFLGFFITIALVPAVILVGFWFVIQLFSEVGSLISRDGGSGGIAYVAHLAGGLFGAITVRLFTIRRRRR